MSNNFRENKKTVLVLGFFDGIHLGHREVIHKAVSFAKDNNAEVTLLTFPESPAEYFGKPVEYIYPRIYNYELIKDIGVKNIDETDFSSLANIEAIDYLKEVTKKYSPIAIFTGFNYSFGKNKIGNSKFLSDYQEVFGYKYFCISEFVLDNTTVSSTKIKELLKTGNIINANEFLGKNFSIKSTVIKGNQIGRKLGFPTANMEYPEKIIKIPYGVYKASALGKQAIVNWGVKPTLGQNKEVLEVHIIDFDGDLYGKTLSVEFVNKIRSEKKFENLEELKLQIEKDKRECLKL